MDKATVNESDVNLMTEEEKEIRRKFKNRIAAKKSRENRKKYLQKLEEIAIKYFTEKEGCKKKAIIELSKLKNNTISKIIKKLNEDKSDLENDNLDFKLTMEHINFLLSLSS